MLRYAYIFKCHATNQVHLTVTEHEHDGALSNLAVNIVECGCLGIFIEILVDNIIWLADNEHTVDFVYRTVCDDRLPSSVV